ncbi:MAG TPA: methyl-accepting chemotaxis protein, partial [Spirochaetia bacterium]|nr:methyl-accepting chemotaxis protein [Spirochaetia bacterium]
MKKSILSRLVGGTILLVVTILLLALCFLAGLRVNRIIADDTGLLVKVQAGVQAINLHVGLLLSSTSADGIRLHVVHARELDTQLLLDSARRSPGAEGAWIYSAELRQSLAATVSLLTSGWQRSLEGLLDEAPRSLDSPEERARFVNSAEAFIADGDRAVAALSSSLDGLNETRRNLASSSLALFALIVGIGTVSALAYSLWGLFSLRRDVRILVTLGRRISEGEVANLPEIRRADEIGEVAAQLRRMVSLQALAGAVRTAAERLQEEHRRIADLGSRAVGVVRALSRAMEETSRGFSGVMQSMRNVQQTAAAGTDAARQGTAVVDQALEKINRGLEAAHALEERASRVEEAVSVIGDVADQTELLSLNA